jgi:hypothetical protein
VLRCVVTSYLGVSFQLLLDCRKHLQSHAIATRLLQSYDKARSRIYLLRKISYLMQYQTSLYSTSSTNILNQKIQ